MEWYIRVTIYAYSAKDRSYLPVLCSRCNWCDATLPLLKLRLFSFCFPYRKSLQTPPTKWCKSDRGSCSSMWVFFTDSLSVHLMFVLIVESLRAALSMSSWLKVSCLTNFLIMSCENKTRWYIMSSSASSKMLPNRELYKYQDNICEMFVRSWLGKRQQMVIHEGPTNRLGRNYAHISFWNWEGYEPETINFLRTNLTTHIWA